MEMKKTAVTDYGDNKFSKELELTEQMTIAPSAKDEFDAAQERGGHN